VEAINLHDNLENLWRFDLCQRCLEIQRYLARHGGNFSDYLVRPVDREEIERLSDREELEKLDQLCTGFGRRCAASGRD
jgi:flavoprotein